MFNWTAIVKLTWTLTSCCDGRHKLSTTITQCYYILSLFSRSRCHCAELSSSLHLTPRLSWEKIGDFVNMTKSKLIRRRHRGGGENCEWNERIKSIFAIFNRLTVWALNWWYRRAALRCSSEMIWMFHVPPANGSHLKLCLMLLSRRSHNSNVAMIIDNWAM